EAAVGAEGERAKDVEAGGDAAGGEELRSRAEPRAQEGAVGQPEAVIEGRSDMVDELEGRGSGAGLGPIDREVVGHDTGGAHGLAEREEVARAADAELDAHRLAA